MVSSIVGHIANVTRTVQSDVDMIDLNFNVAEAYIAVWLALPKVLLFFGRCLFVSFAVAVTMVALLGLAVLVIALFMSLLMMCLPSASEELDIEQDTGATYGDDEKDGTVERADYGFQKEGTAAVVVDKAVQKSKWWYYNDSEGYH